MGFVVCLFFTIQPLHATSVNKHRWIDTWQPYDIKSSGDNIKHTRFCLFCIINNITNGHDSNTYTQAPKEHMEKHYQARRQIQSTLGCHTHLDSLVHCNQPTHPEQHAGLAARHNQLSPCQWTAGMRSWG